MSCAIARMTSQSRWLTALPNARSTACPRTEAASPAIQDVPWEELALALAEKVVEAAAGLPARSLDPPASDVARVTRVVRRIENGLDGDLTLAALAAEARLSRFHFLRTFERLTGLTPHQFVRRARLREAATRLAAETGRVLDLAYDSGFGDLANFKRPRRFVFVAEIPKTASGKILRRLLRDGRYTEVRP